MTYSSDMLDYQAEKEAKFEVECSKCRNREILDKDPGSTWNCLICKEKDNAIKNGKLWNKKLLRCDKCHKLSWIRNINEDCPKCYEEKVKRVLKRHLEAEPKKIDSFLSSMAFAQIRKDNEAKELRKAQIETHQLLKKLIYILETKNVQ